MVLSSKLLNRLFSKFDDDNNGTVDYKELIMGLEIFKENSIEDKLKGNYLLEKRSKEKILVFFELCDADKSGNISEDELYNILKRNIISHHEKIKLRQTGLYSKTFILNCNKK